MENDLERGWRRVRELVESVQRGDITLCSEAEANVFCRRYPYAMALGYVLQQACQALGYLFPDKKQDDEKGGEQA